jgi:hypothetical protein
MILVAIAVPLGIALASLVVMVAASPTLPDPIATHWGPTGAVDGYGPWWATATLPLAVVVGYSILAMVVIRSAVDRLNVIHKVLLVTAPFIAAMVGIVSTGSVLIQRGLESASDAPRVDPVVLVAFATGCVIALAGWFALPKHTPPAALAPAGLPEMQLGEDARGTFIQSVEPSRAVSVAVILILATAAVVGSVSLWLAAPLAVFVTYVIVIAAMAGLVVSSLFWRVTVDRRGVRTISVLGWPRFVYPLSQVDSASAVQINPLGDFGGWGLRWAGRWGVILRSGEALQVNRTNGRSFVVTVTDSRTAAALLNALAKRVQ